MNKQEFLSNVMQEIEAIKEHATKKEIGKLDFGTFVPEHPNRCIYGQMKGDCYSKKAAQLIIKCTPIVVYDMKGNSFTGMQKDINGKPTEHNIHENRVYFSVLEVYITRKGAKNKSIIQYLKGETKTLKL